MVREIAVTTNQARWRRRLVSLGSLKLAILFLIICQVLLLKHVSYSSVWLERGTPQEQAPSPDFEVGSMRWDVASYGHDPSLEPLREFYRKTCKTEKGLGAALLIAEEFSHRFPFGDPKIDFFHPAYRLLEDFDSHVERGEPGHCVTISGLMVDVLLSAGCPARVVQVYSPGLKGHNVVEVWDDARGWILIDPSYMVWVRRADVLDSVNRGAEVPIHKIGKATPGNKSNRPSLDQASVYFDPDNGLLRGPRVYPEPWLYLRLGPRTAPWPFRGRFVVDGPPSWRLGLIQNALRAGIASSVLVFLFCLVWGMSRRLTSQASSGRSRWWASLPRGPGRSSAPDCGRLADSCG